MSDLKVAYGRYSFYVCFGHVSVVVSCVSYHRNLKSSYGQTNFNVLYHFAGFSSCHRQ